MKNLATNIILIAFLLTGFLSKALAQEKTVTGKITDTQTGEALPFVNVVIKNKTVGVSSDLEGNFQINMEASDNVLVFSYIGYATKEVELNGKTNIAVTLDVVSQELEDIVVIGYGVQRRSDLTGSVTSIKADKLPKISSMSPLQAIQGKVAGVQVVSSSGQPGSGVVVRVRGVGTFNNTNPIYVVDGVILDNIDYLNAADIESIEVLKDASATTIYGSRGANGVIIVTTRTANSEKGKSNVVFSSDYSIQVLQKRISLLNGKEYGEIVNEIKPGTYNNLDALPNTDWQDLIFTDGFAAPIYNAQISISGASEKSQFYLGFGYYKQYGIISKSNFERFSLKLNNSYNLSKAIKLGNNITVSPTNQQNTNGNVVFVAYRAWPVLEPYQVDGSYTALPGTGNPLADIEYTNSFSKGIRATGNFFAELNITKSLMFKSSYGMDVNYNQYESFSPVFFVSPQQQNTMSRLGKGNSNQLSWIWENTLTYFKEFEKSRINVLAGYTMQEVSSEYLNLQAENLVRNSEDFWYLDPNNLNENAVGNGVNADAYYSILSYLFRANYTYNEKYLFTATYRLDGSSKFTEKNRYAGFPALAVGWNLHNESFMENVSAISNLKFRASWGGVGNEKILYSRQYSLVGSGINAVFGTEDAIIAGQTYSTTGNPDLVWETTYQTNAGFELGLWDNKVTAEIDYFRKVTNDILVDLTLPGFVGNGSNSSITQNAAKVLNSGIEFSLKYNKSLKKLNYSIGILGNTLHNEALEITGTGNTEDYLVGGGGFTRSKIGLPVGAFYGYQVDGVFQNQTDIDAYPHRAGVVPGDLRFVDVNGDGILTDDDRTYLGSPIPNFMYGLNFSASYQGFDLNIDFQGQSGNKIYNVKETIRPDLYNFESHVYDRWTGDGTSETEPRATQGGYNYLPSSFYVQDGSFFRLRYLSLGYNLPRSFSQRLKMQNISLSISGTNIFILTKYTGYTPEIMGGPISSGLDYGTYPVSSIYSVGLKLSL